MRIALDYDGTYTRDPQFWNAMIEWATQRGHEVICVTMRDAEQAYIGQMPCPVYYSDMVPKAVYMAKLGIAVDVWVDDKPQWIFR